MPFFVCLFPLNNPEREIGKGGCYFYFLDVESKSLVNDFPRSHSVLEAGWSPARLSSHQGCSTKIV